MMYIPCFCYTYLFDWMMINNEVSFTSLTFIIVSV
uniref:Uncharacterized protein n=1 Tax=Siphoviridae sp. ctNZc11 TaxID=2827858 RepID=A0A8S5TC16_9CAUD|nr:MAG TPA: hypothetical protein [Siphoviridae sp. ctNZc11]